MIRRPGIDGLAMSVWLLSAALAIATEVRPAEYGPCVCSSVTFVTPESIDADTWDGATTRAITIALDGDATICYDAERLAVAALWRGGFLDFSNTHHTSYKGQLPPRP